MESTLHALGQLLVQAVPTIIFFILLTFYLKVVFFRPVARILEERRKATEGARLLAQQAFDAADQKGAEFERAIHAARAQIHQEHEALRKKWSDEQNAAIARARAQAEAQVEAAKHAIEEEVRRAESTLDQQVESLSEQIVNSLTRRRAA